MPRPAVLGFLGDASGFLHGRNRCVAGHAAGPSGSSDGLRVDELHDDVLPATRAFTQRTAGAVPLLGQVTQAAGFWFDGTDRTDNHGSFRLYSSAS